MSIVSISRSLLFFVVAALVPFSFTQAMDAFEFQVYDAEINKPGNSSLETHINTAGAVVPPSDGSEKLPTNHLTHFTFEYAHGLTRYWELGAYLQTALSPDGTFRYAGTKLRSKFVLPREEDRSLQLGLNFEISNVPPAFETDRWGSELRPIIGYTIDRVTVTFNPIIGISLTSGTSATPEFSPAAKVLFDTQSGYGLGAEYYTGFGELNKLEPFPVAEQYIFAAFDLLNGPLELNVAAGPGLNSSSSQWVAKVIFGFLL